ncbi:GAF domain-containing protein [Mucilaginibacter sp. HMF5004]|uniref:GAF domain-containing protein n=1 Tax=Mucilaginibacter rivuli TaxID=2857527 RepID=UPI001C5D1188|nr:GAF domain-containing protein [Mucilaginibacter rivuli]MBW4891604.1 GAF domain-containing protein [Mucilaginibacter rivuli]
MQNPELKKPDTVKQFEQFDFDKNKDLNELVSLASALCDTPIAMITLLDSNIQWIKNKKEEPISSTGHESLFCKQMAADEQVLAIPDTLLDGRLVNNPGITGKDAIRFYAGAPLITTSGYHIGTLCVLDHKPHVFTKQQSEMLEILSKQVIRVIDLDVNLKLIKQYNIALKFQKEKIDASERKLRAFFDSSESCHVLLDKDIKVLDFNKATDAVVKKLSERTLEIGQDMIKYVSPALQNDFLTCFKRAFKGKSINNEFLMHYGKKGSIWWQMSFEPVRDQNGLIFGVALTASNINERKNHLAEISTQNESLRNIANIQSHEYRRPVASIMGLMDLIRHSNYKPGKEYLLMMEKAVQELDEKIRNVVNYTQTGT